MSAPAPNKTPLWTRQFLNICLINVLLFSGTQIIIVVMPLYLASVGADEKFIGLTAAVTMAASLLMRPWSGLALDRFSKKIIMVTGIGMILVSVLFLLPVLVPAAILIVRFAGGLGAGLASTTSTTIASQTIPRERLAEGIGYFTMSQSLALALAPVIGIAVYNYLGFQALMLSNAALLTLILLLALFVHDQAPEAPERPAVWMPFERKSGMPAIAIFFVSMASGAIVSFVPLFGVSMEVDNAVLFFTAAAASLFITRFFTGHLSARFGYRAVALPGFIVYALSVLLLFLTRSLALFIIAGFLQGVGYGAVQVSLQSLAILKAPANRSGAANATFFTGIDAGYGLGCILAGLMAQMLGYRLMFLLMSCVPVIGLMIYTYSNKSSKTLIRSQEESVR